MRPLLAGEAVSDVRRVQVPDTRRAALGNRSLLAGTAWHKCRYGIAITVAAFISALLAHAGQSDLPVCSDEEVIETLIDIFFQVQQSAGSGVEIVALEEISDLGAVSHPAGGEWGETRGCAAQGKLRDGKTIDIWYKIVLPSIQDTIGYRLKMCINGFNLENAGCDAFTKSPTP